MPYFLIVFYYFIAAGVDVMDKFLLSARKIHPLSYTFFTVVTGLIFLIGWPWTYEPLLGPRVALDLLSGVIFSLAIYGFFKALSQGEASRVVPFIFAIVPVTDLLLGSILGRNILSVKELAAMSLLLPGALLIVYRRHEFSSRHALLKISSALLWSVYYALWQYAARDGNVLNHLMWNRIGAAVVLILLLAVPFARKNIFASDQIPNKIQTSALFVFKQLLGGMNFVFLSFLLVFFKISLVNGLQGFRYIFLLIAALLLSVFHKHILKEQIDRRIIWQKIGAIILIFLGTAILFAA